MKTQSQAGACCPAAPSPASVRLPADDGLRGIAALPVVAPLTPPRARTREATSAPLEAI
jgi:hypothetical protein